jgi:TRAP-type C4-dicarboxylate transport system substrate-binding protein
MSSLNVSPFMGAIVMNQTTWRRIPDKYKPAIQAICKRIETEIENSIVSLEAKAITDMVSYGLTINTLSAENEKEWYDDLASQESKLAGPIFNEDIYRKIVNILAEYRRGQ